VGTVGRTLRSLSYYTISEGILQVPAGNLHHCSQQIYILFTASTYLYAKLEKMAFWIKISIFLIIFNLKFTNRKESLTC